MEEFTGKVEKHLIGNGSLTERHAVMLVVSPTEQYVLRMLGKPLVSPELDQLVGKTLKVRGTLAGRMLSIQIWIEM